MFFVRESSVQAVRNLLVVNCLAGLFGAAWKKFHPALSFLVAELPKAVFIIWHAAVEHPKSRTDHLRS
jgi:hypothetical protein